MIYLLTAIGLSPGGSNTHLHTKTIHRTIQNKQYIEKHNNWMSVGRAPSWLDMIYLLLQLGCHPVAEVQYTFSHKQYIEQHNNWMSEGRAPSWLDIPWHLPYNRGKSMEKPQSG